MAVTLADTFTDTDGTLLADHDPDTGDAGSWEAMAFGAGGAGVDNDLEINNNRLQPPNPGGVQTPIHRNSTDPGADEYDIAATMAFTSSPQSLRYNSICVRMTPSGTANGDVDRYLVFGNGSSTQEWQLYKTVSGSLTLLDSASASLAGSQFDVRVEVRSSGTTIAVFADSGGGETQVLSTTDTDITQRGRVGVGSDRGDSEHWLDDLSVDSVSGGITVSVGQATETDLAQPIGTAKAKEIGQPSETDLAQPVTAAKAYTLGLATSSETAQPITARKTYSIGQASETDTAFGITATDVTVTGQATETDQALPITALKTYALGLAVETDTALTLVTGEPTPPIVLPPYREPPVPDYQEAAVPAYRERSVPAYQESAS